MYNKEQIKEFIPHREPFLLIDEIVEMEEGKSITAIKHVSEDEYYFKGHFPEKKVMPGVLIVEAMAQAGAVSILSMPQHRGKLAFFAGIKEAKFRRMVVPGDELRLVVRLDRLRSRAGSGSGEAYVGDELACKCEFSFILGNEAEGQK
ncbi:MAG: 3-hydroxyacyl-ACP dehydratase FabZ [Clostridia bacterium]|nr:3-hydroxyacyl-ACP dehydratase FabZ [Clostridia bacterium]